MRFKMMVTLMLVTSLSAFARTSAAQGPPNPSTELQSAQSAHDQQQTPNPAIPDQRPPMGPVTMGAGMTPGMMQMMGAMSRRSQDVGGRGPGSSGPLQRVSRLLAALDDPRVRTILGLTDQQA